MKVKNKNRCKCKRKVILIKYDDRKEKIIFKKTVNNKNERIVVEVKCDTKTGNVKKQRVREKYPVFREQLEERIVPCCQRPRCRENVQEKISSRCKRHRNTKQVQQCRVLKEDAEKRQENQPLSPIVINSESDDSLLYYDDISSASLSSYNDEEIDELMKATRKRIKNSDKEWNLLPRPNCTSTPSRQNESEIWESSDDINSSLNSLKTLVLEPNGLDDAFMHDLNYQNSHILSPENIVVKKEPYDINDQKIKLEPFDVNQNCLNQIKTEFYEESTINAVAIKLEKNNDNTVDVSNISVKQELYGDL